MSAIPYPSLFHVHIKLQSIDCVVRDIKYFFLKTIYICFPKQIERVDRRTPIELYPQSICEWLNPTTYETSHVRRQESHKPTRISNKNLIYSYLYSAVFGKTTELTAAECCNINICAFLFQIDKNNDGFIELNELKDALDQCGFRLPGYRVREMVAEYSSKQSTTQGKLSYEEFEALCVDLKAKEVASTFKTAVSKKENVETLGGMSSQSADGTTHSVRMEEQLAFSDWINSNLILDKDLKHLLPIDAEGKALYQKIKDGILLCKIINHSCPDTIDERAINKKNLTVYREFENLTLALVSSQAIGCNIVNIDAHDLAKGKPHLVLGLLWQIIRIGLFSHITLDSCPGLATLLFDGERLEDLLKLSPEAILLRWVNYHLERAGVARRCTNFQSDITDSEVYTYLLKQIAPADADVTLEALREHEMSSRAEVMLQQAAKLNCRSFLTPQDVVNGVYKLNLAFVANLFNNHPGLDQPEQIEGLDAIEETREEKSKYFAKNFPCLNELHGYLIQFEYHIHNFHSHSIFFRYLTHAPFILSLSQLDELDGCIATRELVVFRFGRRFSHLPIV